jgi:hypothetical protein
LKAALIEVLIILLSAIICGKCSAKMGINLRVIVRQILKVPLDFIKNLKAIMVLSQLKTLFSLSNLANEDSIVLSY